MGEGKFDNRIQKNMPDEEVYRKDAEGRTEGT